jgi:exonuclease SbcC
MKPIKLIMQGFGPYGNKEVIDFTQLEDNTLFLITGATGSGKTTIFDAISYALYGEGSGENREPKDFISQFSDLDTTTQVELIFELKGKKYKIRRVPEQLRYKKIGEGTTTQATVAELEILDDDRNFSGVTDVNEKVNEIIGLDSNQFTQIMMIPQGEFRKMLVAESKEREKILQKLFDTTLYENIQQRFKDVERDMKKDIENRENLLRQAATRTEYKENEKMKEYLNSEYYNYNGIFTLTEKLIKEDKKQIKEIEDEQKKYTEKIKLENKKLTKAKTTNEKIEEKDKLKTKLNEEMKKEVYIKSLEERAEKGKKYLEIKPFKDNYTNQSNNLKEIQDSLKSAEKSKEEIEKEYTVLKNEFEKINSKEFSEEVDKLKDSIKEYKKILPKIEEKKKIHEDLNKVEKNKKEIDEDIKNLQENLANYNKETKETGKAAEKLIDLKDEVKEKEKLYEELKRDKKNKDNIKRTEEEIKAEEEKIIKIKEDISKNDKVLKDKLEKYEDLKEIYYSNMGAILAKELKDGEPCPVCGSKEHVMKAEFKGEDISKEDLNKFEKEIRDINNKISKYRNEETALNEKIKGLKKNIENYIKEINHKDLDFEELIHKEAKIRDGLKDLNTKINETEELQKRHKALEKLIEEIEKNKEDKSQKQKTLDLDIAKYQTQLQEINKSLKADLDTKEVSGLIDKFEKDLKERQSKAEITRKKYNELKEEKIKVETQLKSIKENLEKTEKELAKTKEIFEKKLEEEGFKDLTDYNKSALEKDDLKSIEKEIKEYEENIKLLEIDIKKLEKDTEGLNLVDIKEIEDNIMLLEGKRDQCQKTLNNLEVKIEKSLELLKELKISYKELETKKEKYGKYSYLSGLVNGRGEKGMDKLSLERFVQIEFFEDIISAANQRLRKMTEDRYYMKRTEEYSRQRQIGLDLDVYDNYTGKTRSVKTLSGGESFKASLALALGLSDVVQSYSGGVQLDTIFIDEGFGSLDPESLENSINCLIDIQEKGRLVGIISHVEELKERIDTRLEVISTNRGSTTKFIVK